MDTGTIAALWRDFGPTAWRPEWAQAALAMLSLPLTWWVATWSSRQNVKAALESDRRERERERERQRDQAHLKLVALQRYLASQILYCAIRVKWCGAALLDPNTMSAHAVENIFRHIDHYSATIGALNTHEHEFDPQGGRLTTRIDDVISLLHELRHELASILRNTSYAQLRAPVDGMPLYGHVGQFALWASEALQMHLTWTLPLLEDEVGPWITAQRKNLEEINRQIPTPELPAPLEAIRRRVYTGDDKFAVPEPPMAFVRGGLPA